MSCSVTQVFVMTVSSGSHKERKHADALLEMPGNLARVGGLTQTKELRSREIRRNKLELFIQQFEEEGAWHCQVFDGSDFHK